MATMASHYDLARFGSERVSFSASRYVNGMGTISKKWHLSYAPGIRANVRTKMVIAVGACASSGGIFDTYSTLQGIDKVIPVDVYVPGCPKTGANRRWCNEITRIRTENVRRRSSPEYQELLASYNIK
jgi:NADH-quinone oxidoreductase subunit B